MQKYNAHTRFENTLQLRQSIEAKTYTLQDSH